MGATSSMRLKYSTQCLRQGRARAAQCGKHVCLAVRLSSTRIHRCHQALKGPCSDGLGHQLTHLHWSHVCWEHAAQPAGLQQLRHPCREKQQGPTQRVHGTILTKLPGTTGLHCDTCIKLIAASDTGAAAQPQGRPKTVSDHAERLNLVPGSESVHTCAVDDATIRRCTPRPHNSECATRSPQ